MHEYCLNLVCPLQVEEKLLDVLLDMAEAEVFTTTHVHSHGARSARLSTKEQVMGRSQAIQVRVLLTEQSLTHLLARLRMEFAGAGIRYWASPVVLEGEIK